MCLIISAPKGSMIPKEILVDATRRNSDGWGIMYHDGRKIITEKSPKPDADAIYELTKRLDHEVVVHLRMTTHGGNSLINTHPFEITPQRLFMMHNGVVDVAGTCSKRSDTRAMVEDIIAPLIGNKPGRLHNRGVKNTIQHIIGTQSNRLVFLDDKGELTYFNKNLGLEWKGLWCSNTYAWTLHSEGKKGKKQELYFGRREYDSWWNKDHTYSWSKDTGTYHVRADNDDLDACTLQGDRDEFKWADKNTQAAWVDVDPHDLVETEYGYEVPRWCMEIVDQEYDDMIEEAPETLAAVIEELRLNYIGRSK